jgi:aryl-alcohol dehydrogenase-like predicted oxidoreductase
MRASDDLIKSGRILYIGIPDAPAWVVSYANAIAEMHDSTPFVGIQILYNLIERSAEIELLPITSTLDIGGTTWSPLDGRVLSGKYDNSQENAREQRGTALTTPGVLHL